MMISSRSGKLYNHVDQPRKQGVDPAAEVAGGGADGDADQQDQRLGDDATESEIRAP